MQLNDETTAELIAGLLAVVNDYRSSAMTAESKRIEAEAALDKAKGETEGVLSSALETARSGADFANRLRRERDAARCRMHELEAKQADHIELTVLLQKANAEGAERVRELTDEIDRLRGTVRDVQANLAAAVERNADLPPLWSLVLKPVNPDCLPADKWCLVKKESGWWMTKRLPNTCGLDGLTAAYALPD